VGEQRGSLALKLKEKEVFEFPSFSTLNPCNWWEEGSEVGKGRMIKGWNVERGRVVVVGTK
jgi:hypothetical protein